MGQWQVAVPVLGDALTTERLPSGRLEYSAMKCLQRT